MPIGYHAEGEAARAQATLADLVAHSQRAEFQLAEAYPSHRPPPDRD